MATVRVAIVRLNINLIVKPIAQSGWNLQLKVKWFASRVWSDHEISYLRV